MKLSLNSNSSVNHRTMEHVDSISDGLFKCLVNNGGRVDIEYISEITGISKDIIIDKLQGHSIYQNPKTWDEDIYKGWESANDYLRGNLSNKLELAIEADKQYPGRFTDNIKAIKQVLPTVKDPDRIYATLGSPWIPTSIIDDYIAYLFGEPFHGEAVKVKRDDYTGIWEIPDKNVYKNGETEEYDVGNKNALSLLEDILNNKRICIMHYIVDQGAKSGKRAIIDEDLTIVANDKRDKLISIFKSWVWSDEERKKQLISTYQRKYAIRKRKYDGSFLEFPTLSKDAPQVWKHQKDAVARILLSNNTLLAHDMGSGKTYTMIIAAMELRRLGLSKRNLFVVPNNIVDQWRNSFMLLYPNAKVFVVDSGSFTSGRKNETLKIIRDNDFDAVIIPHSCFDRIPISRKYIIEEMRKKRAKLESQYKKNCMHSIKERINNLNTIIKKEEKKSPDTDDTVYFDDLNVDRLFLDEAHLYKNIALDIPKVKGLSGGNRRGAKKSNHMLAAVHMIQQKHAGKGAIFATGTPITNSITELYVMQKYLQEGELKLGNIRSFADWIGMYAESEERFEISPDTAAFRLVTRYTAFHNLDLLAATLASIASFHTTKDNEGIPQKEVVTISLERSKELTEFLEDISKRADRIHNKEVSKKDDNFLRLTHDGRSAALDMRLIDPFAPITPTFKVFRCAENVADIYFSTNNNKSSQLVLCDEATPKRGWNVYDELKRILVGYGIPENEIAFVQSAKTDYDKQVLYKKVCNGEIRVLLGSSQTLGIGVNVQRRLTALHHLDVPWRPADMQQREGRILRKGNENESIKIYRYVTSGSFDAYSWQILHTKEEFITRLLSCSVDNDEKGDIDDSSTVLDYATVKALAVDNELVKERVEIENELARKKILNREKNEQIEEQLQRLEDIKYKQSEIKEKIAEAEKDLSYNEKNCTISDSNERKRYREIISHAIRNYSISVQDYTVTRYRGYDIVISATMKKDEPWLWIKRNGQYYIDLDGWHETGLLVRIDNVIENLEQIINNYSEELKDLSKTTDSIKKSLNNKDDYQDEIDELENKLAEVDKKLGVTL